LTIKAISAIVPNTDANMIEVVFKEVAFVEIGLVGFVEVDF
ncbi:5800_t:CDS:1, partial [Racocetra fulgida]